MLKVGITGNIASGKSQVENIIKKLGYIVFDLDIISHKLLENNSDVKALILKEFNTLDRKIIGNIIFNNKEKKEKLEKIIHPKLKEFCINEFNKDNKIVFISGALLYESSFDSLFDKIIYVDANKDLRIERLIKRNNLTKEEALLRINSQQNNKSKADFIIENNSDLNELEAKVNSILHELICK